jgi:alpha-L-fucosidase
MGRWLEANGEAIYGTRPWVLSGEGPTGTAEGHLSENKNKPYTAEDIRFTQDGESLYAFALDWPEDGILKVTSLNTGQAVGAKGIRSITLLGSSQKLDWRRDDAALNVTLPSQPAGEFAYVLKITPRGDLVMP